MEISQQVLLDGFSPTWDEDIQNNNYPSEPVMHPFTPTTLNPPGVNTRDIKSSHTEPLTQTLPAKFSNISLTDQDSNLNQTDMNTINFQIGSTVTRVNNIDNKNSGPGSRWFDDGPSSLTNMDEYIEDPLPGLMPGDEYLPENYCDPSLGYIFVNNQWNTRLDNSDALLKHLQALGVRVNQEYLDLDLDLSLSRSASVSTDSENGSVVEEEQSLRHIIGSQMPQNLVYSTVFQSQPNSIIDGPDDLFANSEDPVSILIDHAYEDEVAEAEILPNGEVLVTYDNYKKYRTRLTSQEDYINYLKLVHKEDPSNIEGAKDASTTGAVVKFSLTNHIKRKILSRKIIFNRQIEKLSEKYAQRIRKFIAEEVTYDAVTPDSGVHESFAALSAEDQEKQRIEWQTELAKTEDEIQTLRQVLAARVKHAQDLKRRLGVTVWREFSDDLSSSFKNVKDSQTGRNLQNAFKAMNWIGWGLYGPSPPHHQQQTHTITEEGHIDGPEPNMTRSHTVPNMMYQKTAGAVSAVGEKTTSLFGGIGAKFGQLKETPTFKSFEERMGSTVGAVKPQTSKMGGSGSNSTQDFQELQTEGGQMPQEGAVPLEANGAPGNGVVMDPALQQQQQQQQQPLS